MPNTLLKCYIHIHKIQAQIADKVADCKWPADVGKYPNKTEIIGLFGTKTAWHNSYAKLFPTAEGYEDMQAWLEGHPNSKLDLELLGVTKLKYTLVDLEECLKKQKGKKVVKSMMKSAAKSAEGAKEKEKENKKKKVAASG